MSVSICVGREKIRETGGFLRLKRMTRIKIRFERVERNDRVNDNSLNTDIYQ